MSPEHTLPAQLTTFIGRETELRAVADALATARLITLVGPGGCGKTRLALEAVAREHRPDGVRWADLSTTSDPLVVPELVAAATGVLPATGDATSSLARQLGDRRMVVCVDNCEHVIGGVAEVALEILRTCPGVTLLATSRDPLGVPGEVVWRVPPSSGADAVALFEERSGRTGSDAVRP